jgi:hypothetical protein
MTTTMHANSCSVAVSAMDMTSGGLEELVVTLNGVVCWHAPCRKSHRLALPQAAHSNHGTYTK